MRQRELNKLARQVGLVSCLHHLEDTMFFNLYIQCCGFGINIFSISDHGSASKNLSILTQKIVSKLSEI
jgi:hypothetical protein